MVGDDGILDRPAYTSWALEALCGAIRKREVFAPEGARYSDPRLLSGAAWESQRRAVCDGDGLSPDPSAACRAVAEGMERNEQLLVGPVEGKKGDRARLEEDEALEETEYLKPLRHEVETRLPKVDLPELLMEVDAWTGFASAFSHLSGARAYLEGLPKSVVAVLAAEATKVGFEPVARASDPTLTRSSPPYVDQNHVRAETIAANARLVDHPARPNLGGGRLASVDGMRFRVPVRTVNAAPNLEYVGRGKGLTYLDFVSDPATGFHAIVIPGTLRDSLHVLDGLLEHNTSLGPVHQATGDIHAYTDVVFGLLGYQFSPRITKAPRL